MNPFKGNTEEEKKKPITMELVLLPAVRAQCTEIHTKNIKQLHRLNAIRRAHI